MYILINSNKVLYVLRDDYVLGTLWIISFNPHNKVVTIIIHE